MRKLMWFTIGFAAACTVGAYLLGGIWLLLLALFFALCVFALILFRGERGKRLRIMCLGLAVAFLWMWGVDYYYLQPVKELDNQTVQTTLEATDYSTQTDRGFVTPVTMEYRGLSYRLRLYTYTDTPMSPGDSFQGKVKLRYTMGENFSEYYSSSGIYLVGYGENSSQVSGAYSRPLKYFAADLRQKTIGILNEAFPEETVGFARALLLGDDSLLDYETNTHLSISGIRHVVAVSGQHVAILFALIYLLTGRKRFLTPLIGFPALLLVAALTGFTPSVNRACIMQALMLLAMLVDREYDPPTALAFAVLTMLVVNPMTVASVSFQLSVACMVGIMLFYQRIQGYLLKKLFHDRKDGMTGRIARWFTGTVSMSLSTTVATLPLCAIYFGTISLVSVLTNLLTLWIINLVFYGILLICVLALFWFPAAVFLAQVLSWPMLLLLKISELLSKFPLSAVYTQSNYIVLWLVVSYILLAIFLFSKDKRPGLLAFCVAASLCAAVAVSWAEPALENYRVTVLNVGQGQCILVRQGDKNYMIDCGGKYPEGVADLAAQTLLSQGITYLDGLILTHYDDDHAGAVEYFISRFPVKNYYLPNIPDEGEIQSAMIRQHFSDITWIHTNSSLVLEEGMLQLFVGNREEDDNESGLCILCRLDNCDILITGDRNIRGETALLQQVELPDLEILIAGHHGSANATGRALLKKTLPELVIISAGEGNAYGHPSQVLLERLKIFECEILCTADNGTIMIRG